MEPATAEVQEIANRVKAQIEGRLILALTHVANVVVKFRSVLKA